MSAEQNKNIVRRFHELFDQGDIAGMESLCIPNCVVYQPGAPQLNLEAFRQMGMLFASAFADRQTLLDDVVVEGDTVYARETWSGTHVGDFDGIPATGKRIQIDVMTMDRIVGGKIVEHRGIFDIQGLMQQFGVVPAPQNS
jgi:steroid delta-isomerase-like uncharacterized protein